MVIITFNISKNLFEKLRPNSPVIHTLHSVNRSIRIVHEIKVVKSNDNFVLLERIKTSSSSLMFKNRSSLTR